MSPSRLTRRQFLKGGTLATGLMAAYASLPAWMPRLAFAQPYDEPRGDVLIVVFLRGGADALNMIVPHGEDAYYQARPRLAIPRPDANADGRALDLDGFFGLHPALAPLLPLFQGGGLSAVHATGSPDPTRSHFVAMDFMERGTPGSNERASGWVGRHLATLQNGNESPIRGIGWGTSVQTALNGGPSTVAMRSIIDYHLNGDERLAAQMMQSLTQLYALGDEPLAQTAESTQQAIDLVARVGYENYVPRHAAQYPETDFGQALRQTAALIRAQVGLETACIDLGGWDTHANQGGSQGTQAQLMARLAEGLAAFHQDMGPDMSRVSVVVMSEFGRNLHENASAGTDHGHGGAMLLMSDNLQTAPVVAEWPGLTPDVLDRQRDLAITMDYRDVLADLLQNRLKNPALAEVFPGHAPRLRSLFRA